MDNRRHFVAVAACARGRLGRHRGHDRGRLLRLRLRRRLRQQQLPKTVLRRHPPQCLGAQPWTLEKQYADAIPPQCPHRLK